MYDDELEEYNELDKFYDDIVLFIGGETAWKQYEKMTEESQMKWQKKLTLMICFKFAPRRTYDISRAEIAQLVADAIEFYRGLPDE